MLCVGLFFFQAEDGIRDLVRSRGLGDVYKRQPLLRRRAANHGSGRLLFLVPPGAQPLPVARYAVAVSYTHLTLPTSDLV